MLDSPSSEQFRKPCSTHAAAAPTRGARDRTGNQHAERRQISLAHVQVIASLMRSPKTRQEVREEVGISHMAMGRYMKLLHDQGVVYIAGSKRTGSAGRAAEVFAMNVQPFGMPDA